MKGLNTRIGIVVHDLLMVSLAWVFAYITRFNFSFWQLDWTPILGSLPFVVLAQGFVLWRLSLYQGLWRFASIPDLWNILRAVTLGALGVIAVLFLLNRMEGIPRASLVLYPVYLLLLLGGPRLIYRMWKDHGLRNLASPQRKRVLIIGAGRAGDMLARDMLRDSEYNPVGFLDDQPRMIGAKVQGIPVYGKTEELYKVVKDKGIDSIVIAIPSASNTVMQRIVELCERTNIPFRTLPRIRDSQNAGISIKELKEVAIEDLLGRSSVTLDWKNIRNTLVGKTVLVSGGGGSIGSELCRQISRMAPSSLVIFENSEYNLYETDRELRAKFPNLNLHSHLGDVCEKIAVEHVMEEYSPDYIFHAAAYKHVPMLQEQTREAVHNNILGTSQMALAADKYNCKAFVLISTDKAVNPTNVMGASKRASEIFCQNFNQHSNTKFITVRFGNVLGSAGSVIPLFQKQIEAGGPVTVTHPDITRYFMTIPEASQLIMQAAIMGNGGEIYVLDMGEPIKITYLAEQLIRLSGKRPGEDIEIVYTGLRPGEKLFEELFHSKESLQDTPHHKILLAESRMVDWHYVEKIIQEMRDACDTYNEKELKELLKYLVPEMDETSQVNNEQLDLLKNSSTDQSSTEENLSILH